MNLEREIRTKLEQVDKDISPFVMALTDNSRVDPAEYLQEVNRIVNDIGGFEVFYVHESVAFPGKYDVYMRRKVEEILEHA